MRMLFPLLTVLWLGQAVAAEDKQINVALASDGAVAAADSLYRADPQFAVANAIDGKWIGPGDDPAKNRCSFGDVPHPHWLWIRFRQPARISRMVMHRADGNNYPVDFVGEYSEDGGATFKTLFEVKDNKMDAQTFAVERSFDPVVTDNFRLRIDRSSTQAEPNAAQVSEVEVFGNFTAKPTPVKPLSATEPLSDLGATSLAPTQAPGLEIREEDDQIEFRSAWLRLAVARNRPQVTVLSWDSIGTGKFPPNLLRIGEEEGMQLISAAPVFSSSLRASQTLAEREGNVIRYRLKFPDGVAARWEIRAESQSVTMAIRWSTKGGIVASGLPSLRLSFDMGVSSMAPLADPPLGPPSPLPLPCLLNGGRSGTVLVRQTDGNPVSLDGSGRWDALLFSPIKRRADRLYLLPAGNTRWELVFSVEKTPLAAPELVVGEPRLRALPRHWLNGFQYRPDFGLLANNIISDACANCLDWQSGVAVFTPPLSGGLHAMDVVRASLDRWLAGTPGYGMGPEWMDGPPALWISARDVIFTTGDKALLGRWLPALERLAVQWKKRDADSNGLYEAMQSGNRRQWQGASNAWDCVNFGHKDAYSLAQGYRGLRCLAELERLAGRTEQAQTYDHDADRIRTAYFPTFFNPKTGILAGWKSRDGEIHDYWFTMINGMAIAYGLVPDDEVANRIMDRFMTKMHDVGYTRFDLGLPWQLVPVPTNDYRPGMSARMGGSLKEDGSDGFQNFCNGGAQADSYYFIQALYKLGRRAEADKIFWAEMRSYDANGFQSGIGGGGEMTRWDGTPSGYEGYLAHVYRDQLALYTGYWGIGFGAEGFYLEPWSPLQGKRVKLGLMYMGKIVDEIH